MSMLRNIIACGVAFIALSSAALGSLNVKTQFGAKGDAQKITDGQFSNVTATSVSLGSDTANFTVADVGKMIWCIYRPGGGLLGGIGTITTVNSPTSITMTNPN